MVKIKFRNKINLPKKLNHKIILIQRLKRNNHKLQKNLKIPKVLQKIKFPKKMIFQI